MHVLLTHKLLVIKGEIPHSYRSHKSYCYGLVSTLYNVAAINYTIALLDLGLLGSINWLASG